jgi:hypothetical protein
MTLQLEEGERLIAEAPVTIELIGPEVTDFLIVQVATIHVEDDLPRVWYGSGGEIRRLSLEKVDLDVRGRLEGMLIPEEPGMQPTSVIVRHSVEDDAVASHAFEEKYPLPIPVIAAYLEGMNLSTTLEALVADDGYVWTMMLTTDVGMYLRYSAAWHMLTDQELVDDLNPVAVKDEALDVYDYADQAGNVAMITAMPLVDEASRVGYLPAPSEEAVEPEVNLVGSVTTPVPTIETEADVATAIQVADENPQHRWYVERRLAALDLPYAVPWSTRERLPEETISDN